jgi:hypothetical protein
MKAISHKTEEENILLFSLRFVFEIVMQPNVCLEAVPKILQPAWQRCSWRFGASEKAEAGSTNLMTKSLLEMSHNSTDRTVNVDSFVLKNVY